MLNYDDWLIMLVGIDVIWKLRNNRTWRNTMVSPISAIHIINSRIVNYRETFNCSFNSICPFITINNVRSFIAQSSLNSIKDCDGSTRVGTLYPKCFDISCSYTSSFIFSVLPKKERLISTYMFTLHILDDRM